MSGIKKILMALLMLLLLSSTAAGVVWHLQHYVTVDFQFYPRNTQSLDLRDRAITTAHYQKLSAKLPDCDILWNVPFQGTTYPQNTKEITLTTLSQEDAEDLDYLTELKTVNAKGCRDYAQLLYLQQRRPELELHYDVALGEKFYDHTSDEIEVTGVAPEEIPLLLYFPNLKSVVCAGGTTDTVLQLREYCAGNAIGFSIRLGGEILSQETADITLEGITDGELALLQCLPNLKSLHLKQPEASAENLILLRQEFPDISITWEQSIFGTVCSSEDTELDLSAGTNLSLDTIDKNLAYFPNVETVFLGQCSIDNEELAAFREEKRDEYKVVWTVQCGKKLTVRTDATTFMPVRENVYYFNDDEAYNLRYCEDMICVDIGHMSIHNIDFVEYMPNLEYLILAHTQLQYIEPIRHCKKLKFLELDWSPIRDYSPLVDCTALEDLNLGNTYASVEPIKEMTWLKHLWMVGCSSGSVYQARMALTDTVVQSAGNATVASGWRNLDNYYAMRDLLGMHYMSW